MVYFGGAIFFEMDDYCAKINAIPARSLTFVKTDINHIFNNVAPGRIQNNFSIKILSFDEKPVTNLKGLIEIIPLLTAKKYFTIDYLNGSPFYTFSQTHVGFRQSKAYVEYRTHTCQPRVFVWDEKNYEWKSQFI